MIIKQNDFSLRGINRERLAVNRIRAALGEYQMLILSGARKVGKTTALLQLAIETPRAEYIDCNNDSEVDKVYNSLDNDEGGLLLLDEIQKIPDCQDLVTYLSCKAERVADFKVIITGSVSALTDLLSHYKGGGRNKLIRMPIVTYLEYLHLVGKIDDYSVDLYKYDYGDSFFDYMRLNGVSNLNIGLIDRKYLEDSCRDIEEARDNVGLSTSILDESIDDIIRAYVLLCYSNIFESTLLYNALRQLMGAEQVVKALRYLLWHGLALFHYVASDINDKQSVNLSPLYLGKEEAYQGEYVKKLFYSGNSVFVVNPLLYSAISDELYESLKTFIVENSKVPIDSDALAELFNLVRQKLSSRPDGFLKDRKVLGTWVECYLRGAFAARDFVSLPLITRSLRDISGREVDLASITYGAMMEVSVQFRDKMEDEVNFHLFSKGNEPCILTTSATLDVVKMNEVTVMKIPYPMLAAFLDRGELPILKGVCDALKKGYNVENMNLDL